MEPPYRDLQALARVAEENGVTLVIENHQDLTADEIIGLLREVSSPWLGVVLDVANPLGTAEEPDTFYKKVMPFVKTAHLKDYRIRMTDSGYLFAAALSGKASSTFPASLRTSAVGRRRCGRPSSWPHWRPGTSGCSRKISGPSTRLAPRVELARTWRFLHRHHEPDGAPEWRTPVELGLDGDAVAAYEEQQFQASVAYLKGLLGDDLRAVS